MARKRYRYNPKYYGYKARPSFGYGPYGAMAKMAGGSAWKKAARAMSIAKKVQKMVNVEYKFHDEDFSDTMVSAGSLACLNEISVGDTSQTRDGQSVKMVSIRVSGYVRQDAAQTAPKNVRLIIFKVCQQDATIPTVTGVDVGLLDAATVYSFKEINGSGRNRYVILKDIKIRLSKYGEDGDTKNIEWYKKLNLKAQYSTADDIPRKNGLWALLIGDATSNYPILSIRSRVRYLDN